MSSRRLLLAAILPTLLLQPFAGAFAKEFNARTDVAPAQQVKINRLMAEGLRTGAAKASGVEPDPDIIYYSAPTRNGRAVVKATPGVQDGCSMNIGNVTASRGDTTVRDITVAARGDIINNCR